MDRIRLDQRLDLVKFLGLTSLKNISPNTKQLKLCQIYKVGKHIKMAPIGMLHTPPLKRFGTQYHTCFPQIQLSPT